MKTLKRNLSSDSWEFSWSCEQRRQRPLVVPQSQSGRNVTMTCFLLCFISVCLLSSGLILLGLSAWSLVRKIPYSYLVDISVDMPYFTLPAGVLCFPSSWIAASIHNNRKQYQFLHLLVLLLLVSTGLLITGSSLGTISKITFSNTTVMVSSTDVGHLNTSLQMTLLKYNTDSHYKLAWDKMQIQLNCCGVTDYNDWLNMKLSIPSSCCKNEVCNSNNTNLRGCLDCLSRDLTWHKHILSSQCYITALIQILAIVLATAVYFLEKHGN